MTNHPNRAKSRKSHAHNPKPDEIVSFRKAAGHTQAQMANMIYSTVRTVQDWEAGVNRMHPGLFELYLTKTHQAGNIYYLIDYDT